MPKTSHQHFSVALLSKVNDKNWPETKIWKTSCVTFFQYLRKKTNQILITIYEADVHTQIQIAAKPPWLYFQVSTTLHPQPRFLNLFISILTKSLFKCLECLLLVGKSRKKYIEISTKNKQLPIKTLHNRAKIFTKSQLNFF